MITLGLNGAFHVVTTVRFREYSPGVVTGTLLFFPATGYLLFRTVQESLLMRWQLGAAVIIAALVQVAVIGSLYLRMDIGWRFRRPRAAHQAAAAEAQGGRRSHQPPGESS
jgi:hypothetical protein